jgi:N-acetylglucosamine kinase-like BadF-type ATPase
MTSLDLVLGIDGGGTKTVALLAPAARADSEAILGRGEAGASNPRSAGFQQALEALDRAVASAFHQAGIARGPVSAACIALAGAGRDEERRQIDAWAGRIGLAQRLKVVPDALPLLAAGTPEGWGVALISGTGSLAVGCDRSGMLERAGGWGWLFGDEGSAHALALAALRAVVQAADGRGPATLLTSLVLGRLQLQAPPQLIEALLGRPAPPTEIASLADLVTAAAGQGDQVASGILTQAAGDLAGMVAAVAGRLGFQEPFPLALAGGVLLRSPQVRPLLEAALKDLGVTTSAITEVPDPALGCLKLARQDR